MQEKISPLALSIALAFLSPAATAWAEPGPEEAWEWFSVAGQGKGGRLERFGIARPDTANEDPMLVADCREKFISVAADTASLGRLIGAGHVPLLRIATVGGNIDVPIEVVHLNERGPEDWDVRTSLDPQIFAQATGSSDFRLLIVGRTQDRGIVTYQDLGETPRKGRAELFARIATSCGEVARAPGRKLERK